MYALIDANSFYTSCEAVFDPSIRGKPTIVLTNNDGCICAINRQAKNLGIPKFSPYFKVKQQCEQAGVIVRSSNYELYGDLSTKMMHIISQFGDDQYIYSIDECFLHFKNYQHPIDNFASYGRTIRRTVYRQTRLPVCVGFAATPTLAKAANHIAKHSTKYSGVAVIDSEQTRRQILSAMQVNQVWGIGKKIAAKLNANSIYNALELANLSAQQVKQNFSIDIEKTVRELNGQNCIGWDQVRQPKQQIYSTRSFGQRIFDKSLLRQALSKHTATVAKKLRQQKSLANRMIIFAASSPFDKRPVYRKSLYQFVVPTNDTSVMLKAIGAVIDSLFVSNVAYYKVGVGCLELIGEEFWQHDLFNASTDNPQLMNCIDTINRRFGPNSISNAAQGTEQPWQMSRQFLSPSYTTNWHALPRITCSQ